MKILILLSLFYSLSAQESYYNPDLSSTGVNQLIIFQNSISSLEPGDEIGIFDSSGITNSGDCTSQTNELLVGSGIWDGEQLEIVNVGSIDNCAFGGFQLPGFQDGNPVLIRVYRPSTETEYNTTISFSAGTGNFGDLFMAISDIQLDSGNYVGPFYQVDLNETGEFQLIIFQNSISSLEPGDEIGIFDSSGITNSGDCTSQTNELLVGSGIWDGEQLEIVNVGSIDNCAFGGFQLPGYQEGNPIVIKIYKSNLNLEYQASAVFSAGTGTFGDLFVAISEISLQDSSWGCTNSDACNFSEEATQDDGSCWYPIDGCNCENGQGATLDCNGDCQGQAFIDICEVCSGGNSGHEANSDIDCNGDCFGELVIDECGECGGDGISDGACDCDGNIEDCSGECGGSAVIDACGICGGPGAIYECGCNELEPGACDCDGNIEDCSGECGGSLVIDICGECGGGQTDPNDCVDGCAEGYTYDCNNTCQLEGLLGNNECNNGSNGEADFSCEEFYFDNGDCPVGLLYFGEINQENNSLPVYLDCVFPVTNYNFSISGINGFNLSDGMINDPSFVLDPVVNNNLINWVSITNPLPQNYGLLFDINYEEIDGDICFLDSNIVTVQGEEYQAELGDCISLNSLSNDDILIPGDYVLEQAYPNPFNPEINIPFSISTMSLVKIDIFDINGNLIHNVTNDFYSSGRHSLIWNAKSFSSGTYLVVAEIRSEIYQQKVVLMK